MTIWVVRHGDDLYIRSYRGLGGSLFRRARERREGRVYAGGVDKDVTLVDADHNLDDQIDAAYRATYNRHGGTYVDPMIAPQAQTTTIKLVPPSWLPHRQRGQKPDDHETQARQP